MSVKLILNIILRSHSPIGASSLLFFCPCPAPGAVGHLSFTEILDTSLKVSWSEPGEKNGVLTGTVTSPQNHSWSEERKAGDTERAGGFLTSA